MNKKNIIVILLGLLSSLSRSYDYGFLIFLISFSWVINEFICDINRQGKSSVFSGFFWFFFSFFFGILYWVYVPIVIYGEGLWLIPIAMLGLPLYLSLYFLPMGWILKKIFNVQNSINLIPINLAVYVVLCEVLYSNLFTGFPWTLIAYVLSPNITLMQCVSVIGVYGLSFLIVLVCGFFGILLYKYNTSRRVDVKSLCVCVSIIFMVSIFGVCRLSVVDEKIAGGDATARIVQGNIPQLLKNDAQYNHYILKKYMDLSLCGKRVDVIIWPEATLPWIYTNNNSIHTYEYIRNIFNECDVFIFGAVRKDNKNRYYNSMIIKNRNWDTLYIYDKKHLLPFGEYIPLRNIFFFKSISFLLGDFTRGDNSSVTSVKRLPNFGMQICYESIFSESFAGNDVGLMVNITNDGWFDGASEGLQHHYIVRAMVIESGVPTIRSNNKGISAVFDSFGREVVKVALDNSSSIDFNIPDFHGSTFFYKYKDIIAIIFYLTLILYYLCFLLFIKINHKK